MGLDNIWIEPKGRTLPKVTFEPELQLYVGMLTDPAVSFRGKCYAGYVEAVTGADLYDDLDNATVLKIAAGLEGFVIHAQDLARMFRAFGDAGYNLAAWF